MLAGLLLLGSLSLTVTAQENSQPAVQPSQPATRAETRSSEPPLQATAEIAVLKAQLATTKDFTEAMLSTVYWSLGTVCGIVLVLFGFNLYSNFSLHERDKAAIRSELSASMGAEFAKLRRELETQMGDKLEKLDESLTEKALTTAEALVKPVKIESASVKSSLRSLQKELNLLTIRSEARYWESQDVPANVFSQYMNLLRWGNKEKDSFQVSEALQKLREMSTPDLEVHVSDVTDLNAILNELPAEYAIHTELLKTALRTVRTY